jgi:hypothetical protein
VTSGLATSLDDQHGHQVISKHLLFLLRSHSAEREKNEWTMVVTASFGGAGASFHNFPFGQLVINRFVAPCPIFVAGSEHHCRKNLGLSHFHELKRWHFHKLCPFFCLDPVFRLFSDNTRTRAHQKDMLEDPVLAEKGSSQRASG